MKLHSLHPWDVTIGEAKSLQARLAARVSSASAVPGTVRHIAGVDMSPTDLEGIVRSAVVVLGYPQLKLEEVSTSLGRPSIPYVPGLLSFRETPVVIGALEGLVLTPDIIIVDGQGVAHPRRFGIACHIGLITDTPTIGCAKSILVGKHGPLGSEAGARAELVDRGQVIGMAVRTRSGVSPVYVSIGHKVDLASAVEWVLASCARTRLPETTKMAHKAAAGGIRPVQAIQVGLPGVLSGED